MLYRNIRRRSTGAWVNILFTADGGSFNVPADTHVAAMAAALSLDASELEAVDSNADARTGTLINQPVTSRTSITHGELSCSLYYEIPSRQAELLAVGKDSWTEAQQRELIELLALR